MATTTQTVIIDFQADFSDVESAVDVLAKAGKVDAEVAAQFKKTNTEIKKQGDALDKTAQSAGKETQSFKKLADLMAQFPKSGMNRFLLQIGQELAGAGVKAEDFFTKTKKGTTQAATGFSSLRQELKAVRDQMQAAALSGGVLSDEYQRLKERAGELDDTIKDVNDDIANAGSDTQGLDNVVGAIGALAGGFSAVQGAAALFGGESEDLQKALLKVNAAMAVANGLQQVQAALTKQGSLTRLADVVATTAQIAVQKIYTFVTGRATAATVAFKVALATTGIGLLIIGAIALANAFNKTSKSTEDLTKDLEDLANSNAGALRSLNRARELAIALAEEQGKTGSQLSEVSIEFLNKEIKKNQELEYQQRKLAAETMKNGKISKELADAINKTFEDGIQLRNQLAIAESTKRKQQSDEQKKSAEDAKKIQEDAIAKAKEAADKAAEAAKKARAAGFADFKAGVELQLLEVEKGSLRELELRKKLANAQLQIDLEGENLTQNQRKLLIQQFFKDRKELEKDFNKSVLAAAVEAEKNNLAAILTNLSITEEARLETRIEFLQIAAAQEIAAAEGNASKIRLINAQLNADIAAAKVESIKKSADEEAALLAATGGAGKRALDSVASNERLKSDIRINAIRQLQSIETDAIDKQIQANRKANQVQGADNRALEIEYEQLLDKKAEATELAEKRITGIQENELKQRRDNDIAYIQATIQGIQELSSIAASLADNQQQRAENAIETQKRELDDLVKAGAITEKEAEQRNKRIEAEERAAKNKAAQAQKKLAVFNAFLAIPQAFIAGLTAPFPIGGPIYGGVLAGLAAIQAGIIASRPVPKFFRGKKNNYSGPGIVGDMGAELIQRADGSMHVAKRPEMVYVGAKDIVYTAAETKKMLPYVNKEAIAHNGLARETFDYAKLAQAVKHKESNTVVNIDKEFISESVANGLMKSNYFGKYYRSK